MIKIKKARGIKRFLIITTSFLFVILILSGMAYSLRTRALLENTLDIIGDLNVSNNITGNQVYGEIWFHNDTSDGVPTVISTAGILVNISGFDQPVGNDAGQELNGFSFETGNALQAQVAGLYLIDYSISWQKSSGGGVDKEYEIHVSVNGTSQSNMEVHRVITGANAVGATSEMALSRLLIGDTVYLQVNATDGTDNIGVHTLTLVAMRIGD